MLNIFHDLRFIVEFFLYISIPMHIIGAIAAMHAIMATRTATSAIAWAIGLVAYPYITLILYLIFGRNRFSGYIRDIQLLKQKLEFAKESAKKGFYDEHSHHVAQSLSFLEKLTHMPFTFGNHIDLLIDGHETFDSIFKAIDAAEEYILVEFYIIRDDELGQKLQDKLIQKAYAGVNIYVLYDDIGSHALRKRFIKKFTDAGIIIKGFQNTRGFSNRFQVNFRNHRKIVVVDGKVAFVGGHNVGIEYLGEGKRFEAWRDTHLQLEGPIVQCVQLAFFEDWYWTCQNHLYLNWQAEISKKSNISAFALASGPDTHLEINLMTLINLVHSAESRIWIASPYFVPDAAFLYALKAMSLKGVDVRVLLPKEPDNTLIYLARNSFIDNAKYSHIKFYTYDKGFMHQKVVLIDDRVSVIGTSNIDNRSFHLNFEISIIITDQHFNHKVEKMLSKDFSKSTMLPKNYFDKKPLWFRLACKTARLFAPIL